MGLYSFVPKKKTKVSAQQNLTSPTSNSQVSGLTSLCHITDYYFDYIMCIFSE